jgi:hypothetical protein
MEPKESCLPLARYYTRLVGRHSNMIKDIWAMVASIERNMNSSQPCGAFPVRIEHREY